MKTLFALRHAKSSWEDGMLEDFDRPLSKRGREAAVAMGAYLCRSGIRPALVLCSPSQRTRETLDRVHTALDSPLPVRFEKQLYLADAMTLLNRVRDVDDSLASVMLVGHNPGLQQFLLLLTADTHDKKRQSLAFKYPTGSLAIIEAPAARWAELAPHSGALTEFVRARSLPKP